MKFLYEKQARRFFLFLVGILIMQIIVLGCCGMLQAKNIQKVLARRELAAASYLLEQGIAPSLLASAWNHTQATEEGMALLEMIGHSEQTAGYFLLLIEQTSVPFFFLLLSVGIAAAAVILCGTVVYLSSREKIYEETEQVLAQYADNQFEKHLVTGQTGTIYQLLGRIEQLSLSLRAKSDMEHKTKTFLRDMISNISHQLKTPLAALSMYTEIILEEPENEEAVRNFAGKSVLSIERMEQLIQSLLKMARLDTGNIVFEKKQCLVSEIVGRAVNDLSQRAKREDKKILTEGLREEMLFCDEEWTKEAVGNLVKNALDHTQTGGVIVISFQKTPVAARLMVKDNGCGIAQEDIYHIFKQFYRSRSSSDRQGAGLGLSLAKAIVEGQGGNLSVQSLVGEGSVFCMTFLTQL